MHEAAKQSIVSILPRVGVFHEKTAKSLLEDQHSQEWKNTLNDLMVQSKLKDVVMLEDGEQDMKLPPNMSFCRLLSSPSC